MMNVEIEELHTAVNRSIRQAILCRRSATADPDGRGADKYDDDCQRANSDLNNLLEARKYIEKVIGSYDE